jgi:hypothetical protein
MRVRVTPVEVQAFQTQLQELAIVKRAGRDPTHRVWDELWGSLSSHDLRRTAVPLAGCSCSAPFR